MATFLVFTLGQTFKKIKPWLWAWASIIAFSQVYVGVHFPLDVVAGGILGILGELDRGGLLDRSVNRVDRLNLGEALDKWDIGWEYYLSTQDYIVVCVDGRGTGARGAEFRKCTYKQLGILEAKDQIETAKYLGKQSYIDKDRIGIWGWSFGGSLTLWSMSSGESIFKAGIAVAPVTDWRLYNTAYSERFMRRPQENFDGYDKTSALGMAEKLNGKLLIVHGSADDNVHVQNTMLYIDKLVEADKQFEMQIYTDKIHSILGKQTRRHLYTRMLSFLQKNL